MYCVLLAPERKATMLSMLLELGNTVVVLGDDYCVEITPVRIAPEYSDPLPTAPWTRTENLRAYNPLPSLYTGKRADLWRGLKVAWKFRNYNYMSAGRLPNTRVVQPVSKYKYGMGRVARQQYRRQEALNTRLMYGYNKRVHALL